jgi:hypothetical protein
MKLEEARQIIEADLHHKSGAGLSFEMPTESVKAAGRVVDYYADKDYESAEGRAYRAKQGRTV